eukprot:324887-Hanusia_phi.AAC.1
MFYFFLIALALGFELSPDSYWVLMMMSVRAPPPSISSRADDFLSGTRPSRATRLRLPLVSVSYTHLTLPTICSV